VVSEGAETGAGVAVSTGEEPPSIDRRGGGSGRVQEGAAGEAAEPESVAEPETAAEPESAAEPETAAEPGTAAEPETAAALAAVQPRDGQSRKGGGEEALRMVL